MHTEKSAGQILAGAGAQGRGGARNRDGQGLRLAKKQPLDVLAALRVERQRLAAEPMGKLSKYPKKNRLCIGNTTVAWTRDNWRKAYPADCGPGPREQSYQVGLFRDGVPIGLAHFCAISFSQEVGVDGFIMAADGYSAEAYERAENIAAIMGALAPGDDWIESGTRFVEFESLRMAPGFNAESVWAAPVNAFIDKTFRERRRARYFVMFLNAMPLEYVRVRRQAGDDGPAHTLCEERLRRRRRAMVRLYGRTLGARLCSNDHGICLMGVHLSGEVVAV